MPLKPSVSAQLMSQMGLGRPGGMKSAGSTSIKKETGSSFSAMENAQLKRGIKTPAQAKKAAAGKPGRQFFTKASGGDSKLGKPSSDKAISSAPGGPLQGAWARSQDGAYGKGEPV